MSRTIYIVIDAVDSWSGTIDAYGAYTSMEAARDSLEADDDIIDMFMDTDPEGGSINDVNDEVINRLFPDGSPFEGKYKSVWDGYEALTPKQQSMADRVMYKKITECELFE